MKFIKALFVYLGTIVGVGIFALPWAVKEIGLFFTFLYFLFLGGLVIIVHLLFSKVCCLSRKERRLPGYVFYYLGKRWGLLALVSTLLGLFGAQLAYLIVGGNFLHKLFFPFLGGEQFVYLLLFFFFGGFLIFKGIKSVSLAEILINLFFFGLLLFFLFKTYRFVEINNFAFLRFSFYPYGVILFSLWGSAIVPEITEMVAKKEKIVKKIIFLGVVLASLVYLLFISIVVGVCGQDTSQDALSGLSPVLGKNILLIGYLFGVITCFTSYIALGLTIKKIFWYDLKFHKDLSFVIATGVPLFFYLLGLKNFIVIISLCGAITIGIESFVHIFLYKKAIFYHLKRKINPLLYFILPLLAMGVIFEIYFILLK